jgi:uncharacterized membrane protein (GlpM family)
MKLFHGIISVLLGMAALYLMFIKAETDMDFIAGFVVLMGAIVFMCFMIMEEQKQEIERLRREIGKANSQFKTIERDGVEYWAYK